MTKYKKAIPTEYKGILFDSKSEAIFARSLQFLIQQFQSVKEVVWQYHPEKFRIGDYVPDFLLIVVIDGYRCGFCDRYLIECKPKRPTNAYLSKYTEYFKQIREKDHFGLIPDFRVCVGSPFNDKHPYDLSLYLDANEFQRIPNGIVNREAYEWGKQYRFDLVEDYA